MSEQHFNINYAKSLPRNITTNIIALIINTLVGLLIVPFFLNSLGQAAYALIPLATSITSYVTLIVDILNASVSRYLTIELQQGDFKKANETYSTSFLLLIAGVAILVPIVFLIAYIAPHIFQTGNIPDTEVIIFFALILGSVLMSTLKSNFMVILFSYNRLDLRNIVSIVQTITQVGLIIVFFSFYGPSLFFVGVGYFTAALVSLGVAYLLSKRQTPLIKFSFTSWNKEHVHDLVSLSVYMLFDNFGCILQSQIALIVVNVYFGAILQAEYSLVLTWMSFLSMLAGVVTNTASPKVYSLIGVDDTQATISFVSTFTKFIGLFIALPISLLCIFAPQLMTLWVGAEFASLTPLVWLLLPVCYFSIVISGQVPIAIAKNKMQFPAVLNVVVGVIYLGLALTFPFIFNNGYYGVAMAYVVMVIVNHALIHQLYYIYLLKGHPLTFVKQSLYGFVAMLCLMAFGSVFVSLVDVDGVLMLAAVGLGISVVYLFVVLKVVLSKGEKDMARMCLPEFLQKMRWVKWL